MRILLDTQAFIWFVENDNQLPEKIKKILENENNSLLISIASLWEITIKMSLGKLKMSCSIEELIKNVNENDFVILSVLPKHLVQLNKLEFYHRDPFDRIIIAQSIDEDIDIASSYKIFDEYITTRIWS